MFRVLPLLAWALTMSFSFAAPGYWSPTSTEARIRFRAQVEYAAPENGNEPDEDYAMRKIDEQVAFMYGSMEASRFRAGPKDDYQIWEIETERKAGEKGIYVSRYVYEGTIALESGFPSDSYDVLVPVNPDLVEEQATQRILWFKRNLCTHLLHPDGDAFHYYFNPTAPKCPLREGREYLRIPAAIERKWNTEKTFPEYDRLIGPDRTIRIDVLMGMDNEKRSWNGSKSRDYNGPEYREIRARLLERGFQIRRLSDEESLRLVSGRPEDRPPFIEELTYWTARAPIRVRMFFGPSSVRGGNSRAFHYLFKDAIENASVMIYGGHSGLGANADIPTIEAIEGFKIQMNRSRYQIFLFNSCSSYTAYTKGFFSRKKSDTDPHGTKNLDILGTGLVSLFSHIGEMNAGLIEHLVDAIERTHVRSYQEIVAELDRDNFFSVSGDEDN
jgi:hypothetical protein